ncbi:MAG: sel1 repeat family protein [Rhizobiaceae bacterium]|jgi:hypothetical protein|nr:sel1 repeat family protein [Rhizobiaceae bacterium]
MSIAPRRAMVLFAAFAATLTHAHATDGAKPVPVPTPAPPPLIGAPFTPPDASRFASDELDASRFGDRPADPAYAAFQRGLYLTALNLALPAAERGEVAGQMLAAEIYARGLGVPRNVEEATRWYMAAAEQGDDEGQLQAALILLGDKPLDRSNPNRAEAMAMLSASAEAGNANAAFNLAQILISEQPGDAGLRAARPHFEVAAERGIPGALYALSRMYLSGGGGVLTDRVKARDLMTRAAVGGLDTAQLDLATQLADGGFGSRDYAAAFAWMRRVALTGNPLAANRLAKLYMYALGTEPDPVQAAAWYIRAKRAGITDAEMEDFLGGLTDEERAAALGEANRRL